MVWIDWVEKSAVGILDIMADFGSATRCQFELYNTAQSSSADASSKQCIELCIWHELCRLVSFNGSNV